MFERCTTLVNAPKLPATNIEDDCYCYMFRGCSSLSYINVSFRHWETAKVYGFTTLWVDGVNSKGIFKCPSSLEEVYGNSYIPENWEIE